MTAMLSITSVMLMFEDCAMFPSSSTIHAASRSMSASLSLFSRSPSEFVPMMKVTVETQTISSERKASAWAAIDVSGYSKKFQRIFLIFPIKDCPKSSSLFL